MTYVNPWADGIKPKGADINAIKTAADGIQTDLSNATDGLGALKTDIGNISAIENNEKRKIALASFYSGAPWFRQTPAVDIAWYDVCWSPALSLFCAVSASGTGNRVMTSPDGITWTIRVSAADNNWWSVCWSPTLSLFCAVANSGTGNGIMTSPDGITWTTRAPAADIALYGVCWSPGLSLFCAVAGSGTGNRIMTSPDGITWTTITGVADNNW